MTMNEEAVSLAEALKTIAINQRLGRRSIDTCLNAGDLHRWMQVIGHDGRLQHSIRSGGGSQVWHSDSAAMNARASRR